MLFLFFFAWFLFLLFGERGGQEEGGWSSLVGLFVYLFFNSPSCLLRNGWFLWQPWHWLIFGSIYHSVLDLEVCVCVCVCVVGVGGWSAWFCWFESVLSFLLVHLVLISLTYPGPCLPVCLACLPSEYMCSAWFVRSAWHVPPWFTDPLGFTPS